jgi:5-methylcytosine-specific restriction enzyme subunit McrC
MNIPIRNLYYLLCYAWDALEPGEMKEVRTSETPDIENLMASVITKRVERLLRKGLERDYQEQHEDSKYIRGRIDFQETTKRMLRRRGAAHVIFDELSPDSLANRILKSTINTLHRFETLSQSNRDELAGLYRGLREVSDIRVSAANFYRVRLHRNNRDYSLLLNMCEMVHRYTLPEERGRGMRFVDFNRDRKKMWKLFQRFVRNFYDKRQRTYRVNPDAFRWCVSQSPEVELFSLPGLETDIVLTSLASRIVIDTKFYSEPFVMRHEKLRVRPSHLNQMFAYVQNLAARENGRRQVDGVILYAGVSGGFLQDWSLFGHKLRVAGVDLSMDWPEIDKSLLSIIDVDQQINGSAGPSPTVPRCCTG